MRHTIGICSILRAVGPAALQEGFNHEIFLCCRLSVVRLPACHGSFAYMRLTLSLDHWKHSFPSTNNASGTGMALCSVGKASERPSSPPPRRTNTAPVPTSRLR